MTRPGEKNVKADKAGKTVFAPPLPASAKPLAAWLTTPLGTMLAASRGEALEWLVFCDRKSSSRRKDLDARLCPDFKLGDNPILASIRYELAEYFAGRLSKFSTRVSFSGTSFQIQVWKELVRIPYGATISYSELARRAGRPAAFRAAAQANARNRLAIIVPCHRVINLDGTIGGYSAGIRRKDRLLGLERRDQAVPAAGRRNAAWKA